MTDNDGGSKAAAADWYGAIRNVRNLGRWVGVALGSIGATIFAGGPLAIGVDPHPTSGRIIVACSSAIVASFAVLAVLWLTTVVQISEPFTPDMVTRRGEQTMNAKSAYFFGAGAADLSAFWSRLDLNRLSVENAGRRLLAAQRDLRQLEHGVAAADGPTEAHVAHACLARMREVVGNLEDGQRLFGTQYTDYERRAEAVLGYAALEYVNANFKRHMALALAIAALVPMSGTLFIWSLAPRRASFEGQSVLAVAMDETERAAWVDLGIDPGRCGDGRGVQLTVLKGSGSDDDPWEVETEPNRYPGCPRRRLQLTRDHVRLGTVVPMPPALELKSSG